MADPQGNRALSVCQGGGKTWPSSSLSQNLNNVLGPAPKDTPSAPMPTTATIDLAQRDVLCELVRNHLGGIGDDFRLRADIGWARAKSARR